MSDKENNSFVDFDEQVGDYASTLEEASELQLKHPVTDEPMSVYLNVLSFESRKIRSIQRRNVDMMNKANSRGKPLSAEKIEGLGTDVTVAAIVGWRKNSIRLNGEFLDYSPKNVRLLLEKQPWIIAQVDDFGRSLDNYFR